MKFYRLLVLLLIAAAVMLPQPAEASTGTVSGIVSFEGTPLPGVEVWIGIQSDPFESVYTCTDNTGYFEFAGLPFDTPMVSAAGFEVEFGELCSNPLLIIEHRQPLLIQTFENHNGGGANDFFTLTSTAPTRTIDYALEAWPTGGDVRLNSMIITSIRQFQRGNTAQAVASMQRFERRVAFMESHGVLDSSTASMLTVYADNLIALFQALG